ncbi:MAG: hypothetical protein AAF843_15555 [Bacteroidota bacterium]
MKSVRPLLLCLALIFGACDKCDECVSEFDFQFQFINLNNNELFSDLAQLQVTDLRNTSFEPERIVQDEDTIYSVALLYDDPLLAPPDTILLSYNNALIDTVAVDISFSNDSDCCNNVLEVGSVRFFNRRTSRLIRPSGNVYNVLIE